MLEQYYNALGFAGAIFVSLFGFLFIMFWFAGIAGLIEDCGEKVEIWKVILFMLFPPYPICWLILDMRKQHKYMNSDQDTADTFKDINKKT